MNMSVAALKEWPWKDLAEKDAEIGDLKASLAHMGGHLEIELEEADKLRAEIAKLRAALEQISRYHDCWVHSYHPAEYARRILEQQREGG